MKTSNKDPANPETADADTESNSAQDNPGRRLQDSLISKDPSRKFNLDRRTEGSDRRVNSDPNYNGPARRNIIDRRRNLKDRRKED